MDNEERLNSNSETMEKAIMRANGLRERGEYWLWKTMRIYLQLRERTSLSAYDSCLKQAHLLTVF